MERATVKLPIVRSTLGLLTTVHQLPSNYQVQYIKIKPEPLDLTIKPIIEITTNSSSMTPPHTPTPSPLKKRYRDSENETFTIFIDDQQRVKSCETKVILSPLKKRYREENQKIVITPQQPEIKREVTPKKIIQTSAVSQKASKNQTALPSVSSRSEKKSKAIRKLKFDEFRSSPVSGTIIRMLDEIDENDTAVESGDIDPQYNIVEVTEEAKAELAQIKNVIGAYLCKLCRLEFDDGEFVCEKMIVTVRHYRKVIKLNLN